MQTRVEIAGFDNWRELAKEAAQLLAKGQLVGLPTETVYGLGADALNAAAVAKVFEVKERPSFNPLILHLAKTGDLSKVAHVPEEIAEVVSALTEKFWPGPLTLILPKKDIVPDIVTGGLLTVAVRVSAHEVMRAVAKELGRPIAAPSANHFGRISPTSASAVLAELGGQIPLIVDGGACRDGLESTIIEIEPAPANKIKPIFRLLRPGSISREELQEFGKVVKVKTDNKPQAPGQLASHYSPKTPLQLCQTVKDFTPEEGKRYGLLSYRGLEKQGYLEACDWGKVEILTPGKGNLKEAAVRFFFALRQLDEAGLDGIVAEPISEVGLGVAMMDRLRRAATRGQ